MPLLILFPELFGLKRVQNALVDLLVNDPYPPSEVFKFDVQLVTGGALPFFKRDFDILQKTRQQS